MPAGDLLLANPYPVPSSGVTSSSYLGIEYVAGVASHHLAFRNAGVDWQLWVKAEVDPLPIKYVITTTGIDRAPQFSVQFSNWEPQAGDRCQSVQLRRAKGCTKAGWAFDRRDG
jgi:hypothetical protein